MKKPKRIFAKINKEKQKEQIKRVIKQLIPAEEEFKRIVESSVGKEEFKPAILSTLEKEVKDDNKGN